MSYLETLRAKPEPVRKRIAMISTVCVTLVLVILWGVSFKETLNTTLAEQEKAQESVHSEPVQMFANIERISLGAQTLWNDFLTLSKTLSK